MTHPQNSDEREALRRAKMKLQAYLGVYKDDKELPVVIALVTAALETAKTQAVAIPIPSDKESYWMWLKKDRLNPDMPTQQMKLHMEEMSAQEVSSARAAIRWANSIIDAAKTQAAPDGDEPEAFTKAREEMLEGWEKTDTVSLSDEEISLLDEKWAESTPRQKLAYFNTIAKRANPNMGYWREILELANYFATVLLDGNCSLYTERVLKFDAANECWRDADGIVWQQPNHSDWQKVMEMINRMKGYDANGFCLRDRAIAICQRNLGKDGV